MNTHRYNRQIILPEFGENSQKKLLKSKVLVIGVGGLGCPVLQFLATAGVGHIGIADDDKVDISNLHRQILYNENSIGKIKANEAKEKLHQINSEIEITAYSYKITHNNILPLIEQYDIIVDGTDNFQIRYLLNDACKLLKKPLVHGAIYQYEGQVSVFNIEKNGQITNYRDLFPVAPKSFEVPNCNQSGVLGTLSGIIGTVQANEVIKLITGIGDLLVHKLYLINVLNYETRIIKYNKLEIEMGPKNKEEFLTMNYDTFCNISSFSKKEIANKEELRSLLARENSILIDIRNEGEIPVINKYEYIRIPLTELSHRLEELENYTTIIFVCQSGVRSEQAFKLVQQKYPQKDIFHIYKGVKTIL